MLKAYLRHLQDGLYEHPCEYRPGYEKCAHIPKPGTATPNGYKSVYLTCIYRAIQGGACRSLQRVELAAKRPQKQWWITLLSFHCPGTLWRRLPAIDTYINLEWIRTKNGSNSDYRKILLAGLDEECHTVPLLPHKKKAGIFLRHHRHCKTGRLNGLLAQSAQKTVIVSIQKDIQCFEDVSFLCCAEYSCSIYGCPGSADDPPPSTMPHSHDPWWGTTLILAKACRQKAQPHLSGTEARKMQSMWPGQIEKYRKWQKHSLTLATTKTMLTAPFKCRQGGIKRHGWRLLSK